MPEERITEVQSPAGNTQTRTTVVERRKGGGGDWLVAIVLLVAVAIGTYFLAGLSSREAAKDNAVADAARDVGGAARDVGDAAQEAARNLNDR